MNNQNKAVALLLYLLWPFSAVIIGLKNFDTTFGRKLLIAAFVFLGYTATESGDLERYMTHYYEISDMSFQEILHLFLNLQISKLFNDVTSLLFSPFNNHHLYFGFLFGFYAYFLVNTINLFRLKLLKNFTFGISVGFFAFALFYSILTIFNYAFYTGVIYFLYFLVKLICFNKRSSYLFMLLTPVFHYGTLPFLLIPLFFIIFKRKTYLYIIALIVCSLASQSFLIKNVGTYLENTGTVLENRFDGYASEEGKERMDERYSLGYKQGNTNYRLFVDIRNATNSIAIPSLLVLLLINLKNIKRNEVTLNLLNISIACMAVSQLMLNISQGERFYFASGFMVLGLYIFYVQKFGFNSLRCKNLLYLIIPIILLNNIVALILARTLISSDFLLSNFIYLFIKLL